MIEFQYNFNDDSELPQIVGETEDIRDFDDNNCFGGFNPQVPESILKISVEKVIINNKSFEEEREFTIDLDGNKKIKDKSIASKPESEIIEKEIEKNKTIKQKKEEKIKPKEKKLFNPNKKLKYLRSHYNKKYFYRVIKYIGKNIKRKRGSMRDNISKKIKVNFFKNIIASLNWKLRKKNINKDFQRLDQNYITDVTKTYNKYLFEKTLKEIIKEKPKVKDKENAKKKEDKWRQNIKLIEELEESGDEDFKHIFEMNMEELFNEYLDSKEFEESIYDLRRKKFYFDYIQNYIQIAENLVNYYKK